MLSWKMDTVQDRLLLSCSFCRNYTTTTAATTLSSTPTMATTTPCESYQPSTTCQSCVRLYEGLTPHLSSCAMENAGKTQNNPSPLSRFHSTGKNLSHLHHLTKIEKYYLINILYCLKYIGNHCSRVITVR